MSVIRAKSAIAVGLIAAAGAFGAVAMLSAATAPTARADELSELASAVDGDLANGQAAFATAISDFGSGQFAPGLAAFFDGVNDDSLNTSANIVWGSVAAGDSFEHIDYPWTAWDLGVPADYAAGLSTAQADFSQGLNYLEGAAEYFNAGAIAGSQGIGDYITGTEYGVLGVEYVSAVPLEELLLGAAVPF